MTLKESVLELRASGMSLAQIATALGCAKSTVHHHLNPKSHVAHAARRRNMRAALSEWVKGMKEASPCTDCGNFYPYYVMDYDHVSGEKVAGIGFLSRGTGGKQRLLDELEKCELVCANCHRIRTHSRSAAKAA